MKQTGTHTRVDTPEGAVTSSTGGVKRRRHAVRVVLDERIGIPDTYSSVSLHVEIEYDVGRAERIPEATERAYKQAKRFIDEKIDDALAQAHRHIQKASR